MSALDRSAKILGGIFATIFRGGSDEQKAMIKEAQHWHKFLIDPEQFGDHLAPCKYADDLRKYQLFKLPFNNVVVHMGPLRQKTGELFYETCFCSLNGDVLSGRVFDSDVSGSRIDMHLEHGSVLVKFPLSVDREDWVNGNLPDHYELDQTEANNLYRDKHGTLMWASASPYPHNPFDDYLRKLKTNFSLTVFQLVGMLNSDGIIQEERKEPKILNASRERKGKPPIFGYRMLVVDKSRFKMPGVTAAGHSHASPRLHWRRGHIRHLPSGKAVAVRPCLVGDHRKGAVLKDYAITNGG